MNNRLSFVILSCVVTLTACDDRRGALPDDAALTGRAPASPQIQQATGLTYLPIPESFDALDRSLARHYPARLRGVRPLTAVLVDVKVDEKGFVREVAAVDPPATNTSTIILQEMSGNNVPVEREHRAVYDRAFGPAAEAAVREVRFRPAIRAGRPVPYTLRMTVEFASPA